jgi:hypothetical protein
MEIFWIESKDISMIPQVAEAFAAGQPAGIETIAVVKITLPADR